jgi:hypothetical protein
MNCEQAVELLTGPVEPANAAERRLATEHAAVCADCRGAVVSVHALRVLSLMPVAASPEGAFRRALDRATSSTSREQESSRGFWVGLGAGLAVAACIALAVFALLSLSLAPDVSSTPRLSLAVNESRDVNISLTSSEPLFDAEIRVTLSGSIDLQGYAGQRELSWHTDLDAGTNQLTLPIVATGTDGGQLLVEVIHSGKRRTFLVDVQAEA